SGGVWHAGRIGMPGSIPCARNPVRRWRCGAAAALCRHSQRLGRRDLPRLYPERGTAGGRATSMRHSEIVQLRSTALTMSFGICLNQSARDRYSTARVSKRLSNKSTACLRARYCIGVPNVECFNLGKNMVNSVVSTLPTKLFSNFPHRNSRHWSHSIQSQTLGESVSIANVGRERIEYRLFAAPGARATTPAPPPPPPHTLP